MAVAQLIGWRGQQSKGWKTFWMAVAEFWEGGPGVSGERPAHERATPAAGTRVTDQPQGC